MTIASVGKGLISEERLDVKGERRFGSNSYWKILLTMLTFGCSG